MPNAIHTNRGTTLVWGDANTATKDYTVTLASLASGAARIGPVHDFGAFPNPPDLRIYLQAAFTGTPTVGRGLELWGMGWDDDDDGTPLIPGVVSGVSTDAAFTPVAARLNATPIAYARSAAADNLAHGTIVMIENWPSRFFSPIFYNDNGTALHATVASLLRVTPIWKEIQ